MRKRKLMIVVLLTLCTHSLMAQPPRQRPGLEERKENIEAMKIAFLTKRLNLTPDEAKVFWPVYNQFTGELKKVREARPGKMHDGNSIDQLNDKEAEKMVDEMLMSRQMELDILKKYHAQFKQVLPVRKVAHLYRAEEEFKKELIERIRERREEMKRN